MPKYQYEFIDMTDHDTNINGTGSRNGGSRLYIHLVLIIILILM